MGKKNNNADIESIVKGACPDYECDICPDKFECDYFVHTFCGGVGRSASGGEQAGAVQVAPQQAGGQAVAGGYGYVGNGPIPNPGSQVQLSPIVIPVSFVPYTTQNQPLYQVETVMPEKQFIKRHGLSLFMLAASISLFFVLMFAAFSGSGGSVRYTMANALSGLFNGMNIPIFNSPNGFEAYFSAPDVETIIGAYMTALSVLAVMLIAVYNTLKYIVLSISGRLKRGPSKSNILLLICVIIMFVGVMFLNVSGGLSLGEVIGKVFINDASLSIRFTFGFYALLAVSVILIFANAFIKTEEYLPVEGAIEE